MRGEFLIIIQGDFLSMLILFECLNSDFCNFSNTLEEHIFEYLRYFEALKNDTNLCFSYRNHSFSFLIIKEIFFIRISMYLNQNSKEYFLSFMTV